MVKVLSRERDSVHMEDSFKWAKVSKTRVSISFCNVSSHDVGVTYAGMKE